MPEKEIQAIASSRAEVGDQPVVLQRILEKLEADIYKVARVLAERNVNRVLCAGSGDSFYASQAVQMAFERFAGVTMEPLQAYEYAIYGRSRVDSQTALIVISSSGRMSTTRETLERALTTQATVIGISDKEFEGNPFIEKVEYALIPGAIKEGMPAQTTNAAIVTLINLAIVLGQENGHLELEAAKQFLAELHSLPKQISTVLQKAYAWADPLAKSLEGHRLYTFVGGGPGFAVAQNGGGMIAYLAHWITSAIEVEEFHHGFRADMLDPGDPVIIVAPDGSLNSRLRDAVAETLKKGGRPLVIATGANADLHTTDVLVLPDISEALSPILLLPALHAFAIEVASLRFPA